MDETINELAETITLMFRKGRNVIIPAFAVGQTQDILYVLNRLVREKRLPAVNVVIHSPLAKKATTTYFAHPECFDEEEKKLLSAGASQNAIRLEFTRSVEESKALNRIRSGTVIIAGSGMCDGGRIRHHLKHNLWRSECSIVFSGFRQ